MVIRVALHSTYTASKAGVPHDIALLLLDSPATKAAVPLGRSALAVNTSALAIGFGRTNWDEPNFVPPQAYAARLQQLTMLVQPDQNGFLVAGKPPAGDGPGAASGCPPARACVGGGGKGGCARSARLPASPEARSRRALIGRKCTGLGACTAVPLAQASQGAAPPNRSPSAPAPARDRCATLLQGWHLLG